MGDLEVVPRGERPLSLDDRLRIYFQLHPPEPGEAPVNLEYRFSRRAPGTESYELGWGDTHTVTVVFTATSNVPGPDCRIDTGSQLCGEVLLSGAVSGVPDGWICQQPTGPIGAEQLSGALGNWGITSPPPSVPEPSSIALICLGWAALMRRR